MAFRITLLICGYFVQFCLMLNPYTRPCMASFERSDLDPQRYVELNNVNAVCRSHDDPALLVYPVCQCTVNVGYRVTFPNISMQNQAFVGQNEENERTKVCACKCLCVSPSCFEIYLPPLLLHGCSFCCCGITAWISHLVFLFFFFFFLPQSLGKIDKPAHTAWWSSPKKCLTGNFEGGSWLAAVYLPSRNTPSQQGIKSTWLGMWSDHISIRSA